MAQDNTNRFAIWGNKKKENDTDADFTGEGNVNGVDVWINAWKRKEGANPNAPALSGTIRPKDKSAAKVSQKSGIDDIDSEIPF